MSVVPDPSKWNFILLLSKHTRPSLQSEEADVAGCRRLAAVVSVDVARGGRGGELRVFRR